MRNYKLSVISYKLSGIYKQLIKSFLLIAICLFLTAFSFGQKANEVIKQGNDAYHKNDFTTAIKDYTKALQDDNKNAIAKFNMANALHRTSKEDKAADVYDDAIKNSGDADLQSKAYYNKALSQLQQKKLPEAIDAFKQSLRLSPGDNDTRENLQKALEEQKQQQQPQNQKQDPKQKPSPQQKKEQQKQQPKMNQQMMEQKFKELQDQEKQLQKDLQKQKTNQQESDKDW